jgi:ABC-type antimicrobial peptide transport system permease subunit
VTAKARNMRRHFSLLGALGTNQKAIEISMLIDTLVGMAMGLAVGCIIGLVVTVLMLNVPLSYLGGVASVSWKGLPMTIVLPVQLLAGTIAVAFLFSLMSAYLVTQRSLTCNIADDLKLGE